MSRVIPCSQCRGVSEKTVLKNDIWQVNCSGKIHRVLVPELIVNMCTVCGEYTIGGDGDEQITEATKLHISKLCEC